MTEHFLFHPADEIEKDANQFVEDFAKENGLTAHTLSASRWYFQSNEKLLEDGFIELTCKPDKSGTGPSCVFSVVDIDEVNTIIHLCED